MCLELCGVAIDVKGWVGWGWDDEESTPPPHPYLQCIPSFKHAPNPPLSNTFPSNHSFKHTNPHPPPPSTSNNTTTGHGAGPHRPVGAQVPLHPRLRLAGAHPESQAVRMDVDRVGRVSGCWVMCMVAHASTFSHICIHTPITLTTSTYIPPYTGRWPPTPSRSSTRASRPCPCRRSR